MLGNAMTTDEDQVPTPELTVCNQMTRGRRGRQKFFMLFLYLPWTVAFILIPGENRVRAVDHSLPTSSCHLTLPLTDLLTSLLDPQCPPSLSVFRIQFLFVILTLHTHRAVQRKF